MQDLIGQSFAHAIRSLEKKLAKAWTWPSAEAGLALHAYVSIGRKVPFGFRNAIAEKLDNRKSQAPVLAAYGYALHDGLIDDRQIIDEWIAGLGRLSKRKAIVESRNTFAYRPPELLGIALGIIKLEDECADVRAWLVQEVNSLEIVYNEYDDWGFLLAGLVASALNVPWKPRSSFRTDGDSVSAPALRCWLPQAHPKYIKSLGLPQEKLRSEKNLLRICAITPAADRIREVGELGVVSAALGDVVERMVDSIVDDFGDPSRRASQQEKDVCLQLLNQRSINVANRSKMKGRRWRWVARFLLSPLVIAVAAAPLLGLYVWLSNYGFIEDFGIPAIVILLALLAYKLFSEWPKSPVEKWSNAIGLRVARRIERRWHGDANVHIEVLDEHAVTGPDQDEIKQHPSKDLRQ